LDNNRELQQDFGPRVHEGPVRRRNVSRPNFFSRDGKNKRIEATLIANMPSHSEAITGFAVSPDHMFFVSSSDDKTVKVWDTARLERNVTSKPRHTYGQHHARVKCVCILEGVHCFASAASLHVVRVHVAQSGALPKYSKLQVFREHRVDNVGEYITCMTHYNTGQLVASRVSSGDLGVSRFCIELALRHDAFDDHPSGSQDYACSTKHGEPSTLWPNYLSLYRQETSLDRSRNFYRRSDFVGQTIRPAHP